MNTHSLPSSKNSKKDRLKEIVQSIPGLWNAYWQVKQLLIRTAMLRYHWYDAVGTWRDMRWPLKHTEKWSLSAELLFFYHKLEKGLVMPGQRRFFGADPSKKVMQLMDQWVAGGLPTDDPIYKGAAFTLHAYHSRLIESQLDSKDEARSAVENYLQRINYIEDNNDTTPKKVHQPRDLATTELVLRELLVSRRSVREYLPKPVDASLIRAAVEDAQQAPSACNRQPCSLILLSDSKAKESLLALQNGNRGFGHLAPHVAIIMSDASGFFDASERHQAYIDGGLFTMAFLLGLQARGISSCCLNWCVSPETDRKAHQLLDLPLNKRIIMLVAVGYSPDGVQAPTSPRRAVQSISQLS